MTSPDRGMLRAARVAAVVACVVGVSLAGHVAGGGDVPGLPTLAGTAAVVAVYAGALTRNRLSTGELIGAIGAGQVLLHMAFMTSGAAHAGGASMLAGHAGATVVLGLVLAQGEAAIWALWCWLRPRLDAPLREAGVPVDDAECLAATASVRVHLTWLGTSLSLRGPPTRAAFDR